MNIKDRNDNKQEKKDKDIRGSLRRGCVVPLAI